MMVHASSQNNTSYYYQTNERNMVIIVSFCCCFDEVNPQYYSGQYEVDLVTRIRRGQPDTFDY